MRKASLWIAAISIVYAITPIVSVLIVAAVANIFGCSINESGTSSCVTPMGDIGDLLSMMGIFGWLVFFTVPTGLLGLIVAIILLAASFIPKRQKNRGIVHPRLINKNTMKSDEELSRENPELYKVAREGGTEAPGSSDLLHADKEGIFPCAVCNAVLFKGDTKFDSGTGWPSFTDPINKEAIKLIEDNSHGMRRTEVRCANCGAHLGHVFPDGPEHEGEGEQGSGKHDRYCINGICLDHQAS